VTKQLFRYDGRFQWWLYTVSHGQLLLRSTTSSTRDTQVDVLFKDVGLVYLPTSVEDIEVLAGDESDLPKGMHLPGGRKIFVVRGREFSGVVTAGVVLHFEGRGSHNDPSPLIPTFPPAAQP
jgi:hypothetical protein